MSVVYMPPRPSIPFDPEPSPFDGPCTCISQMRERMDLHSRYDAVRAWEKAKHDLENSGFVVVERRT
mgnify:CR=1 FL=1